MTTAKEEFEAVMRAGHAPTDEQYRAYVEETGRVPTWPGHKLHDPNVRMPLHDKGGVTAQVRPARSDGS